MSNRKLDHTAAVAEAQAFGATVEIEHRQANRMKATVRYRNQSRTVFMSKYSNDSRAQHNMVRDVRRACVEMGAKYVG